jgi:uncharacterized protein (TIGR00106 family)
VELMAIVQVSVVPIGTATTSLSRWVAETLRVLRNHSNLKYQLTPMGTVIEGELDEVLEVVREMHETPFKNGATRVLTALSIDDRRDQHPTLESKVDSVMKKLQE